MASGPIAAVESGLRGRWMAILSASAAMFLWGFVLAIAPLATQWPFVPAWAYPYLLVSAPASLIAGNLILGRAADALGRKRAFIVTLATYGAGVLLIAISRELWELVAGIAMAELGLGGEEPAVLAYLSEMTPSRARGRVLVGVTNVANAGAVVASSLAIATSLSLGIQRVAFGAALAASVALIVATRLLVPESIRWELYVRDRGPEGGWDEPSRGEYALRLSFLVSMAVTIVLTYALMALVIGPYLFPRLTPWIVLEYNLGETVGGLAVLPFIDRFSRRAYALASYLGGTVTMAAFIPQYALAPGDLGLFLALLFANGVFGELGWGARVMLEPELFPTRIRSTGISIVRSAAYSLYIASIFFTEPFTALDYLLYNVALWSVGLMGSIAWYLRGTETAGRTLEDISGG